MSLFKQESSIRSDEDAPSPLDAITVREVLSTAKGTNFYVLTVAGPHGVTAVPGQIGEEMVLEMLSEEAPPQHILNVTIPPDAMQDLRRQ